MLTKEDVTWAYRLCLDREPENGKVVQVLLESLENRNQLVQSLINSTEYKNKYGKTAPKQPSPFWHYLSAFDAIGTINKYAKAKSQPSPYYATNFLGVKMRLEFYPTILAARIGTVEPAPIPANWHADIAEWASCLRSVDLSGERFVMLELGCGWGCWINNLGVAAKSEGKRVKLYGVEADQQSLHFARLALNDNGITENEFVLSKGIAGKAGSVALFPSISPEKGGGGAAIFSPTNKQLSDATNSGKYVLMPAVDIGTLIKDEEILDFMHVDIQGAELDLLTEIFDLLCKKVRYIFIGTHSKQIEAGLFDLFMGKSEWKLEMERPAIFTLIDGRPVIKCDGVQAWRNGAFD
ncbi:MAG: FkbM family methyltransferase [Methylovulum sp.]|nr:FkbM family methyltransferase [Methylovulum sp.]